MSSYKIAVGRKVADRELIMSRTQMDRSIPGSELVITGLKDIELGKETLSSLLVHSASIALYRVGVLDTKLSGPIDADLRLYRLLLDQYGDGAHSKYNAYRRRLLSFLRYMRARE